MKPMISGVASEIAWVVEECAPVLRWFNQLLGFVCVDELSWPVQLTRSTAYVQECHNLAVKHASCIFLHSTPTWRQIHTRRLEGYDG